jgi:hypothetical protein
MAKVIVERPRHGSGERGHGKGYWKTFQRTAWEDQPRRERIRTQRHITKVLNEHLGPLRRYLLAQVGRPWNQVFSEICTHINRSNPVQDHVRDHVWDYVAVHVKLADGVPVHASGYWIDQPLASRYSRYLVYVCPRTGLLRRVPSLRRKHRPAAPTPPRPVQRDADHYFCFCQGVWQLLRVKKFPINATSSSIVEKYEGRVFDAALNEPISRAEAVVYYGAAVYGIEIVRRLTRRELRLLQPARAPTVMH